MFTLGWSYVGQYFVLLRIQTALMYRFAQCKKDFLNATGIQEVNKFRGDRALMWAVISYQHDHNLCKSKALS